MADGRHRLAGVEEGLHEGNRLWHHSQTVGIHDAARQQERIEVARLRRVESQIDGKLIAPVGVLPAADAPALGRDDTRLGARLIQGGAGFCQLELLEAVGGKYGDLQRNGAATPEQFRALRQTQLAYRDALNHVSLYAFANGTMSNQIALRERTYLEVRVRLGLPAQMATPVPRQVGATSPGVWTKVKAKVKAKAKAKVKAAARAAGKTQKRYRGVDQAPKYVAPTQATTTSETTASETTTSETTASRPASR